MSRDYASHEMAMVFLRISGRMMFRFNFWRYRRIFRYAIVAGQAKSRVAVMMDILNIHRQMTRGD